MDSDLKRFEQELERLSPGHLPEGLIARMEAAMEGWEHGEEESAETVLPEGQKVVPFPQPQIGASRRRRGFGLCAAAAGVALLGALVGLMLSDDAGSNDKSPIVMRASTENLQPVEFAPQAAKRTILNAPEESMIVANGAQPVRVLRLDYVDRVVFRNAAGEEVHLEVPAVNYRLIPAVTD